MSSVPGCDAPQLWEATLGQLLLRVTRQNYDTWLRNTAGLRFDGTTLVVAAANDLACDWLATRMRAVIAQALATVAGAGLQVRYEPVDTTVVPESVPLQPSLLPGLATPLNPRFTFTTFLPADFNRMALNAALDIATSEQATYSPLFITGGNGTGKTHLLHAIAHEALKRRMRVVLAGAEQFLSEYTTAVRQKTGAAFRARYHELDLLLVDDVHKLLGKRATLNELYQTLANLHDKGSLVAVTGDLAAMNGEAYRFQNALGWGLVASIQQPSVEDRVRFIRAKAEYQSINLPDEVQHYIALRVRASIRDLEGAVNRVTALARISREPMNIDFAARALQPVGIAPTPMQQPVQPTSLLEAVCNHLSLAPEQIAGQKRDHALTYARHIAMYLLRHDAGLTYSAIAHFLGKKDHSTVVHACAQLQKQLSVSPELRADIDAIRAVIHGSGTAA